MYSIPGGEEWQPRPVRSAWRITEPAWCRWSSARGRWWAWGRAPSWPAWQTTTTTTSSRGARAVGSWSWTGSWWDCRTAPGTRSVCSAPSATPLSRTAATTGRENSSAGSTTRGKKSLKFQSNNELWWSRIVQFCFFFIEKNPVLKWSCVVYFLTCYREPELVSLAFG